MVPAVTEEGHSENWTPGHSQSPVVGHLKFPHAMTSTHPPKPVLTSAVGGGRWPVPHDDLRPTSHTQTRSPRHGWEKAQPREMGSHPGTGRGHSPQVTPDYTDK